MKRFCHFCGKVIERVVGWKYQSFCSAECRDNHRSESNVARQLKYHRKMVKKLEG